MALDSRKVNLFIVGAAKCGTTSLHYYLSQHEEIFMSLVKEPNFFADVESPFPTNYLSPKKGISYNAKIIKDLHTYQELFENCKTEKYIGEASPAYLWDKNSARRIYEYNPSAKIIVIIGDPIERAYSHYLMQFNGQAEKSAFDRLSLEKNMFSDSQKWYRNPPYVEAGLYFQQISRYLQFFPKEQIKIIKKQDLFVNTLDIILNLSEFLEISTSNIHNIKLDKVNESMTPKNKFVSLLHSVYNKISFSKYINNSLDANSKLIIKRIFFRSKKEKIKINEDTRKWLKEFYKEDLELLEHEFGIIL